MERWLMVLVALYLLTEGECHRYCKKNDDCSELGDELMCVKTSCDVGICGCPRGKSARYRGYPPNRYICAPNKRVGQKCSTDGRKGVCKAPNSYCHEESGQCKCMANYREAQEGKLCTQKRLAGETCQPKTVNTLNNQCDGGSKCSSSGDDYPNGLHSVIKVGPGVCACSQSQILDFQLPHGPNSDWTYPFCRPKRIGDFCLRNADCPNAGTSGGKCEKGQCKCEPSKAPNYEMTNCMEGLAFGAVCNPLYITGTSPVDNRYKHCDGSKGLVCGDMCDPQTYSAAATTDNRHTCTCGPKHRISGSTCLQIGEGDACYGDENCKGVGPLAKCIDGACQSSAEQILGRTTLLLGLALVAYLLK